MDIRTMARWSYFSFRIGKDGLVVILGIVLYPPEIVKGLQLFIG